MKWQKLGLIFRPEGEKLWAKSHAMVPTPIWISGEVIRVYVTFQDNYGVGRPGFFDVAARNPTAILRVSSEPLIDIGRPGTFDDNGVMTTSVVNVGEGLRYMYYVGFEKGVKTRYRLLTGLAISEDNGNSFSRFSKSPILDRSDSELFFRGGAFCIAEDNKFKLWYVAGSEWITIRGKAMPKYEIRYIESKDGINWPSEGCTVLPVTQDDEHGFGRPYVFQNLDGSYRMFYSVRRRSVMNYRMGYAESNDGIRWTRKDEFLNLDISIGSFDSHAIMYGAPININGCLYLFYNGNDFGREGVGLAVCEYM
ncbi:glycoside hydrolase family protein [Arenicellales bacterium IMCC55707]